MISRSSLLAIRALAELSQLPPEECEGAAKIAKKINAPANYLGKVLQSLVGKGLVMSYKGKDGGFRLARSPKKITLLDIVDSLEDVNKWTRCFLGRKQCLDSSPCPVHIQWKGVKASNIAFLKGITLADLNS